MALLIDITLFEGQIHLITIINYALIGLWTYLHSRKHKMKLDAKVIWIVGVVLVNVFVFESIWGNLVWVTHGGQASPMALYGTIVQAFGFPLVLLVKRDFGIAFNVNWIAFSLFVVTAVLFTVWYLAPFPHQVVKSEYFPQELYEGGVHVPNMFVSILNKTSKAVLSIAVTYLLLGTRKN